MVTNLLVALFALLFVPPAMAEQPCVTILLTTENVSKMSNKDFKIKKNQMMEQLYTLLREVSEPDGYPSETIPPVLHKRVLIINTELKKLSADITTVSKDPTISHQILTDTLELLRLIHTIQTKAEALLKKAIN